MHRSYCNVASGLRCGTAAKPVDCYLKSAANATDGSTSFFAQRVSGSPGAGCRPDYHPHIPGHAPPSPPSPPSPPPPPPPPPYSGWRFFNLLEAREGATLARLPDLGGGYLKDLGCTNGDTTVTCPAGVLPAGLRADDASVFCNVGSVRLRRGVFVRARVCVAVFVCVCVCVCVCAHSKPCLHAHIG